MNPRALITTLLLTAVSLQAVLGGLGVPTVLLCFGHHEAGHTQCEPAHHHEAPTRHTSCSCSHGHDHKHNQRQQRFLESLPVPHAPDDHDHPHERCTDIELTLADLTSLPRHDQATAPDLSQPMVVVAVISAPSSNASPALSMAPTPPRHAPISPSVGTVRAVRFQV